jgi:hypothetical protein
MDEKNSKRGKKMSNNDNNFFDKKPDANDNFEKKIPKKAATYWKKFMKSTNVFMSRGAQNISRFISWARKDNWRRSDKKSKK